MKTVAILGSTGSIGRQALEVVRRFPNRFRVAALAARRNVKLLAQQAREFSPEMVVVSDPEAVEELERALAGSSVKVTGGIEGVCLAASLSGVELVLAAMVGVAGLVPVLWAVEAGKDVALANKEALVVGGELLMQAVRETGVQLLPVDSEHSALFQCLAGEDRSLVRRVVLTSSGGPFRGWSHTELSTVTPSQALAHPTWKMGAKITIDSATLMNKGFEILEARWLFDLDLDQVEVLIHPQSIIHSLVEFCDGSVKGQLAPPDMRLPIQFALGYPDRLDHCWTPLDLARIGALTFEEPDNATFPCLNLARRAGKAGGTAPAVLNAVNEVAVELFLSESLPFSGIASLIEEAISIHPAQPAGSLEDLLNADRQAREWARLHAQSLAPGGDSGPVAANVV